MDRLKSRCDPIVAFCHCSKDHIVAALLGLKLVRPCIDGRSVESLLTHLVHVCLGHGAQRTTLLSRHDPPLLNNVELLGLVKL